MAYNADMEWPPASMAKMMNLLVAQEQINAGRFSGNDLVRISERAAHTGGSRVGLKEGDVYPLRELMKAALVKSANDAAVAVAEKIGGSVEAMVRMMNERAQQLGMTHTLYQTVDGLPPRPTHDADRTTAYDLAIVGRAIIRETNLLMWSGQEHMDFDNGVCHPEQHQSSDRAFRRMRRAQDRVHLHGGIQRHHHGQARQHAADRGDPWRAVECAAFCAGGES